MSAIEKKMKPIDDEIARVDAEIARLQGIRDGLTRARELLTTEMEQFVAAPPKRATNIKPLVLDFLIAAGTGGATSSEVSAAVKERVTAVKKDTVGSVLSRLKADGALVFDGERYFDARFAPKLGGTPAFN